MTLCRDTSVQKFALQKGFENVNWHTQTETCGFWSNTFAKIENGLFEGITKAKTVFCTQVLSQNSNQFNGDTYHLWKELSTVNTLCLKNHGHSFWR